MVEVLEDGVEAFGGSGAVKPGTAVCLRK